MEEENLENISSQYLNNEQIKVYLEACLDHRITDFQELGDSQKINEDYDEEDEGDSDEVNLSMIDGLDRAIKRKWGKIIEKNIRQ